MKKHLLIITLIAAVLMIGLVGAVSAAYVPVAQFKASSTSGEAPLTVFFTDQSTGSPTSYAWKFGDGTTSTAKNPTHKYKAAGNYTVTEIVKNRAGSNTLVKKRYIKVVTPKPTTITTTVATPVPTTIATTVATPVPTTIATTVATPVPTTVGSVTNAVEAAAYANTAYTQGNARLAQMQQAYKAWAIPSRPDLVQIATNVRSSGLKGDGVTDDTAALQALLTKLPSGSTIYFPPGHYRIDGPVYINRPFTLFGESGTIFDCQKATQEQGILVLNIRGSPTSTMNGMTITGIVFEGPGIETHPIMIDAYYLQNFNVSYVKFHNIGIAAIYVRSCMDVSVEKSIFDNVFYTGLGYGVNILEHSDRINIHDNFFVTKGRHGVTTGSNNADITEADYVRSVTVENNYFENTTHDAIDAHHQTLGTYTVKGNVMNKCAMGIGFRGGEAEITDNVMINCYRGISLENEIGAPNLDPKVDRILNNIMINTEGIAIEADRSNVLIQGNFLNGMLCGWDAICINPDVPNYSPNNYYIIGNVVENYTAGFGGDMPGSTISLVGNFISNGGIYQSF